MEDMTVIEHLKEADRVLTESEELKIKSEKQSKTGRKLMWLPGLVVSLPLMGIVAVLYSSQKTDDWLVARYAPDGEPTSCWKLPDTHIYRTEGYSSWEDQVTGNQLIVAGNYSAFRVENDNWQGAADSLGIDLARCVGGQYRSE